MIDADGYLAFSLRRLASELHVSPSTVIHHVGQRHEVLVAVVDAILSEVALSAVQRTEFADWRDVVRRSATSMHDALRRHPRASTLVIDLSASSSRGIEASARLLIALHRGGVELRQLRATHLAILALATGFALQANPGGLAAGNAGLDPEASRRCFADQALNEEFAALIDEVMQVEASTDPAASTDRGFSRALEALIAGLEMPTPGW